MTNLEIYNNAFKEVFNVEESALAELEYQSIPEWDSVGHMNLLAVLEEGFDIVLDTDDIIDFSSYEKGREILAKYNKVI